MPEQVEHRRALDHQFRRQSGEGQGRHRRIGQTKAKPLQQIGPEHIKLGQIDVEVTHLPAGNSLTSQAQGQRHARRFSGELHDNQKAQPIAKATRRDQRPDD